MKSKAKRNGYTRQRASYTSFPIKYVDVILHEIFWFAAADAAIVVADWLIHFIMLEHFIRV